MTGGADHLVVSPSATVTLEEGPPATAAGPYDTPGYVLASAAHEHARPLTVSAGGAQLALLGLEDGALKTVYGYPRPSGEPSGHAALAGALLDLGATVTLALEGEAASLAAALEHRVAALDERPLAAAALSANPAERFHKRAQRAMRTAVKRGAIVEVGRLEPWFGPFYRAGMEALEAHELYFFGDAYFATLARADHAVVTVRDEHGVAAATLFLFGGGLATYHLGARRSEPDPVVGAMNLALAEGLAEGWRRGATLGLLGGGRTAGDDDPLLAFKRQLAPDVVRRRTYRVPR